MFLPEAIAADQLCENVFSPNSILLSASDIGESKREMSGTKEQRCAQNDLNFFFSRPKSCSAILSKQTIPRARGD